MKRSAMALAICLLMALTPAALGQSARRGWDGTWFGGWDRGNGVQLIFAGETLVGFYLRNDYKDVLRTGTTPGGGRTFAWDKGEATVTRTQNGGATLVVRETGRPEVSVSLKREGE